MAAEINIYNPEELGPPMGQYTHVTRVRANEFLFIAGMLSGDAAGNIIGEGALLIVDRLVKEPFLVEVQTIAAV